MNRSSADALHHKPVELRPASQGSTAQSSDSQSPDPASHAEVLRVLLGILLAMFLAALDQTIIATALPTIGRDLGDLEHLPWVVTVYLLTSTAVTPLCGKLSDTYGRRIVLLTSIAIFILGSLACALASSMTVLILARGLQGIGGGGLIALAQAIIADLVAPRERARYQVYFASVFMSASLLGPVLGGVMAEHLHWSLIFWINLPLGALAYGMSSRHLKSLPRYERPHRLDFLGTGLLMAATVTVLLALTWGGLRYAWISAPVLGLAAGSALLWVLFAWRMRSAPEPLIPADILHNPIVRAATIAACFGMGTYIGLTIYLPVYFETVRGLSASLSGLALIPLMAGTVVGATLSGRIMSRVRHYKRLPVAGLATSILATGLLAAFANRLPVLWIEGLLAVISIGMGTLLPVSTVSIQNAVAAHQMGTATGTANFFRSLGGALLVAIFGAIIIGGSGLPGHSAGFENFAAEAARAGVDLSDVFQWMFAAAGVGFAVALAALLRMEERTLRSGSHPAAEAMQE